MQSWSWNDYDIVVKNYPFIGDKTVELLKDKSLPSMLQKVVDLHLSREAPLTDKEKDMVKLYGSTLGTAMIFLMPQKHVPEIEECLKCGKS